MSWDIDEARAKRHDGVIVRRRGSGWFYGFQPTDYDTPIAGADGRPRRWRTVQRGVDAMDTDYPAPRA